MEKLLKTITVSVAFMFCGSVLLTILELETGYSETTPRVIVNSGHFILGCLTFGLTSWVVQE